MHRAERYLRLAIAWAIKALVHERKDTGIIADRWLRTAYDIKTGMAIGLQNDLLEERIIRVLHEANLNDSEIMVMQRRIHNEEVCAQKFRGEDGNDQEDS